MMKPVLILVAAIVGGILIVVVLQGRQATPPTIPLESVAQAAQADLPHLIGRIQVAAQDFGFTDEQEVTKITLGLPYELYYLNYDQLERHTSDMSAEQVLEAAQRWEFPVLFDGEARGMARFGPEDGELRFVGFAATPQLAQNLVDFQAKHDRAGEMEPVKLWRISPLHTNFALTQRNEQIQLTLILDVEPNQRWYFTNLDESQTYDLEEVIPQIVQELNELEQKYDR